MMECTMQTVIHVFGMELLRLLVPSATFTPYPNVGDAGAALYTVDEETSTTIQALQAASTAGTPIHSKLATGTTTGSTAFAEEELTELIRDAVARFAEKLLSSQQSFNNLYNNGHHSPLNDSWMTNDQSVGRGKSFLADLEKHEKLWDYKTNHSLPSTSTK